MTYASKQDLIAKFDAEELAQLTDSAGATTIDDSKIAEALKSADALIGGYVASRYALPLSPVPDLVVDLACAIARFRLWKDRASERVRTDFEDAISTLKGISNGSIVLPGAPGLDGGTAPPDNAPSFAADERRFSDSALCGFA